MDNLEGKISNLLDGLHSDYVHSVYHLEEVMAAFEEWEGLPAENITKASVALTSMRARTQELLAIVYLLMQKAPPEP